MKVRYKGKQIEVIEAAGRRLVEQGYAEEIGKRQAESKAEESEARTPVKKASKKDS